jgi:hypothetical protein
MYIDSLTIVAFVVFVVAMGVFVKICLIDSCILLSDRKASDEHAVRPGDEQ